MAKSTSRKSGAASRRKGDLSRRDEFLAAALRRFSKFGFSATSTREICADVGVAHSAVYNYFPSKESILLAIEEREMTAMQAGLDAVLSTVGGRPPLERLELAIRFTLRIAAERREAWRLMAEMLRSLKPRHRGPVIARRDRYEKTLRELMKEAAQAGEIPDQDISLSSLYLFGIAESLSGWFRPDGRLSAEQLVDHAANFVLKAIVTGHARTEGLQSARSSLTV